ncbi:MAG: cytochrome c [Longimicrobiales bacterium]
MRSREWQAIALAGLTTFALACGGDDQAASEGMDQGAEAEQAAETGGETMQEPMDLPEGITMDMVNQGNQLFSGQGGCHACHNPQATGTQLAPDLTDDEWINISSRDFEEIVSVINTGVSQPVEHPGPMPPMGGANLNAEQVEALAAYIVSLGG